MNATFQWYARLASGLPGTQPVLSLTLGTSTGGKPAGADMRVLLNRITGKNHKVERNKRRMKRWLVEHLAAN